MLIERINALIWTCALELPVYTWWMRTHVTDRTIVIAVPIGLQCVTQPWLWEYTARTGSAPLPLLGAEAAQHAADMRSVRAHEYVRDFERRLEPYRDAAPVRGYRERVAAFG